MTMERELPKDPFLMDKDTDDGVKNKYYKHDTIVNLYNDIKLYDKQAEAQASEIDDSVDVEVREEILKSANTSNPSMFRRPVLLIVILLIAVAIFILCPFLQLASEGSDNSSSEDNKTWSSERTDISDSGSLVQINNLWDG
ncbi:hypothetical protein LOTGIDRAFT_175007 [Lottia gigantea]|uniref:Uncharacterized protein n=1 Tax=Lottia gigantea TaxID=225164 RepID=V4AQK3_LOTGI|nr:hypothetical protein LOTGIDRAFT_175007 [Lottia gigantea]ESO95951.1 hypothetical protein LOTGIDRAFT_175007 [Lottia gigantea]